MKIIIIIGPQAVGKMTVGQELEKLTGLKLFHNHLVIDLVANFFEFDTPQAQYLRAKVREEFFRTFAKTDNAGYIYTIMIDFDDAQDFECIEEISAIFSNQSAEVYWVELAAGLDERLKRNRSDNRLAHKPSKRDIATSDQHLIEFNAEYRLNSRAGKINRENYLRIDNSCLSAHNSAQEIMRLVGF
jgi:hypothetical protein